MTCADFLNFGTAIAVMAVLEFSAVTPWVNCQDIPGAIEREYAFKPVFTKTR